MFSYLASPGLAHQARGHVAVSELEQVRPAVSIIIPTLNEVDNIETTINDVLEEVAPCFDFEILVADGGSTDGTRERVRDMAGHHAVRLVDIPAPGGLAEDVFVAARSAIYPVIVVLDADGSHPASFIKDIVYPVAKGDCDMAVASRYVEGGTVSNWPLHRRVLSRLGAAFAAPFTDIRDPLSGFFALRRDRLLSTGARAKGFKIGLEAVVAGGDALRVRELPIPFQDRLNGTSKIGLGQFTAYFEQLVRFSRGTVSGGTIHRFASVGMAGFVLDFFVVAAMRAFGADIVVAHICGFCLAALFNYAANAKWSFEGRGRDELRFFRFLIVAALALSMRGGLIATSADLGLPFFWIALAGIGGGGIVSYLGNEFYVFRNATSAASAVPWKLAAIAIAAYVFVLKIVYQGSVDLMPQEAYYWNYAQHPALSYLDHPPMIAWLISAGTAIFGDSEFGVRAGAALAWLMTALFACGLAANLYGRSVAFLVLLLISCLPFFFTIGLLATPEAPLAAAWAGALYYLERALMKSRKRAWLGAGICIGVGLLSKYTIALLGPATIVFMIIDPSSRRWFLTKWPYLCAILAIAVFSPVIIWNAANDWVSFQFQGSRRWFDEDLRFSTPKLLGFIAAVLGPLGVGLAIGAFKALLRPAGEKRAQAVFGLVFCVVPLFVFLIFSLFHSVKLNWTGPVWLALLPGMAHVLLSAIQKRAVPPSVAGVKVAIAVSVLVCGLCLHYLALGLPFVGYSGTLRGLPVAWEEFVEGAEQIKAKITAETRQNPLLVGMDSYGIASQLAFYRSSQTISKDITSENLIGGNGLMHRFWWGDRLPIGRVVIMYGLKEGTLSPDGLERQFEKLGPIERRVVRKNGAVAGHFFYRVGYGFRQRD
ncbi:glycosyltransferase family 39 protein [Agrobacterium genomosp. 13]|uniref:PMT family glycosyltransferase, 4-amino-4-deoxy-L-arabinose transferase n=1 Tax=Agrobacterium genomosp. 13 str. CFBP 6927 TaxID=1183428 RepID=A0ABP2BL38_9HYPH|nr:glycosyltransferase family 39 protein [Agrobacterium genomosp. 13]CUX47212.1 PMT family glycosyltransferase, 4-amino-4-deoxy-L-arabinose transferase [Agrobacterium genomosp. 13 str. CFBP 6927]